jgi:hypothetical protein
LTDPFHSVSQLKKQAAVTGKKTAFEAKKKLLLGGGS